VEETGGLKTVTLAVVLVEPVLRTYFPNSRLNLCRQYECSRQPILFGYHPILQFTWGGLRRSAFARKVSTGQCDAERSCDAEVLAGEGVRTDAGEVGIGFGGGLIMKTMDWRGHCLSRWWRDSE